MKINLDGSLHRATNLAQAIARAVKPHYVGPVVLAGGYWRDLALGLPPKDLDVFLLDSGMAKSSTAQDLCTACGPSTIGGDIAFKKWIPCYDKWGGDIHHIVKARVEDPFSSDIPVGEIDFVFMSNDEFRKHPSRQFSIMGDFFAFVLDRFDLRLNALGGCSDGRFAVTPQWADDAMHKRLVVQCNNRHDSDRIDARLQKFLNGKFSGWTSWDEQIDGDIKPHVFFTEGGLEVLR